MRVSGSEMLPKRIGSANGYWKDVNMLIINKDKVMGFIVAHKVVHALR